MTHLLSVRGLLSADILSKSIFSNGDFSVKQFGGAQWLSDWFKIEGLWVRSSSESLRCVLRQDTLAGDCLVLVQRLFSTGSALDDLSKPDRKMTKWDVNNQIKQFGCRSGQTVCIGYQLTTLVGKELSRCRKG